MGLALSATYCAGGGVAHAAPNEAAVAARGTIEPVGRVHTLAAPAGSVLGRVLVKQGEQVKQNQVVAQTNRLAVLTASVELAKQRLLQAQAELARVRAPAKDAERQAQQDLVRQCRAELDQAKKDEQRAKILRRQNLISPEAMEIKTLAVVRSRQVLRQAQATLGSMSEARPVDVAVAEAGVKVAQAELASARAQRNLTEIRAPMNGTILMLDARAGDAVGPDGILKMADLSHLMVIAEVNQRDVSRVHLGESVRLSGGVLPGPVRGKVTRIAKVVYDRVAPTSDILAGRDERILEVEISPDQKLPSIVGGELDVLIPAP